MELQELILLASLSQHKREAKSRKEILESHITMDEELADLVVSFDQSILIISEEKKRFVHSSLKHLGELERVLLAEMQVNTVHTGKFLLCRTIADPNYHSVISTVVEDENGDVEIVYLLNLSKKHGDPASILPNNSILVIKEPYLQAIQSDSVEFVFIRIESPSDLIVLNDHLTEQVVSKCSSSAWIQEWQSQFNFNLALSQGDEFLDKKSYFDAIRAYTRILILGKDIDSKKRAEILVKRALAYFNVQKFYLSYTDTNNALFLCSNDVDIVSRAYHLKAKSAYELRMFNEALTAFEKCLSMNKSCLDELQLEIERARKRVNESNHGQYNFDDIIDQAKNKHLNRLDVADYVSPDIEIFNINNDPNNKGIIAKKDIKRNTLLVGAKAISIAYESEIDETTVSRSIPFSHYANEIDAVLESQNISELMFLINDNPSIANQIYSLYSGPKNVERRERQPGKHIIDLTCLDAIVQFNSYLSTNDDYESSVNNFGHNEGLWLYPSYFNHSCLPNTKRIFLSDVMFIYSKRDIKKGEEITVNYVAPREPYEHRHQICSDYAFECTCRLCQLDRKDVNLSARLDLIDEARNKQRSLSKSEVDRLVESLRSSYQGVNGRDEELKLDMIEALLLQGDAHANGDPGQAGNIYLSIYLIYKSVDDYTALYCLLEAIKAFKLAEEHDQASLCVKTAREFFIGPQLYFDYICRQRLDGHVSSA